MIENKLNSCSWYGFINDSYENAAKILAGMTAMNPCKKQKLAMSEFFKKQHTGTFQNNVEIYWESKYWMLSKTTAFENN